MIEMITEFIENIFKLFGNLFSNFLFIITISFTFLIVALIVIIIKFVKPAFEILSISEEEALGEQLKAKNVTPYNIYTEKDRRYIRKGRAINFKVGLKNITRWLGKRGTAYTFETQKCEIKIGSLYDALKAIWGEKKLDQLKEEYKNEIMNSKVWVTVDLEEGLTPNGFEPISETYPQEEARNAMLNLIGARIKKELSKEDYIKLMALLGCGIGLALVLIRLGVL